MIFTHSLSLDRHVLSREFIFLSTDPCRVVLERRRISSCRLSPTRITVSAKKSDSRKYVCVRRLRRRSMSRVKGNNFLISWQIFFRFFIFFLFFSLFAVGSIFVPPSNLVFMRVLPRSSEMSPYTVTLHVTNVFATARKIIYVVCSIQIPY